MSKLLVNAPSGRQEIIEVGAGGAYFDPDRVIWDERVDGPLPEDVQVGGMVRTGSALAFSQELYSQQLAATAAASATAFRKRASDAIQVMLDKLATDHGYDNIISLCSYAASTKPKWKAEGEYGLTYRDACWAKAKEIQDAVLAGTRPLPTMLEVMAEMPQVQWPDTGSD
jgi:hypothetical protein